MNRAILALPWIALSLIIGILTGLVRLGWEMPINAISLQHGGIMVGSFLGTVILLERAIPLKIKWLVIFPVVNGLSIVLFFAGFVTEAFAALIFGGIGMIGIYIYLIYRYKETYHFLMITAALGYLLAAILMIRVKLYPMAINWWMMFILITIVGERLELSRFLPKKSLKQPLLVTILFIYLLSFILPYHGWGYWVQGGCLIFFAIWLIHYDMVRKSIRSGGLHRFSGVNLLAGYVWLMASGLLMILSPQFLLGYDAFVHAFFLGFTFSMIFAHGPIILPGLAKLTYRPYHPFMYTWSVILQVSVLLRVVTDLLELPLFRQWSGIISTIAIVGYLGNLLYLMIRYGRGGS